MISLFKPPNYLCIFTDKCLLPYYGSCSFTRECESTDLDVNCRFCRPGWARVIGGGPGSACVGMFEFSLVNRDGD